MPFLPAIARGAMLLALCGATIVGATAHPVLHHHHHHHVHKAVRHVALVPDPPALPPDPPQTPSQPPPKDLQFETEVARTGRMSHPQCRGRPRGHARPAGRQPFRR